MAELEVDGNELVVRLEPTEKVEAVHGDLRFPMTSVKDVQVVEDALGSVHGIRAPGLRVPEYVAAGTFHYHGKKIFAVVHREARRGVHVSLEGESYDELIIGTPSPEASIRLFDKTA